MPWLVLWFKPCYRGAVGTRPNSGLSVTHSYVKQLERQAHARNVSSYSASECSPGGGPSVLFPIPRLPVEVVRDFACFGIWFFKEISLVLWQIRFQNEPKIALCTTSTNGDSMVLYLTNWQFFMYHVCPVIDPEFRHNIIKVSSCGSTGL